jgi:hypothetical protein
MDTPDGETIVDHLAGVEDYTLAMATYRAAIKRSPNTRRSRCGRAPV